MNSYIVLMFGLVVGVLVGRMWKFWEDDKKLQKAHEAFIASDRNFIAMMKEAERIARLALDLRNQVTVEYDKKKVN